SPFDYEAVDILEALDVPFYKIASPEIVDLELIYYIANKQKPVIISTGMSNLEEIEDALKTILKSGNNKIVILHCNTLYPTPLEAVNLKAIKTLEETFEYPIGFSDHTKEIYFSVAAVAMGACIIERHFTLDHDMPGFDHKASLDPKQFKEMVKQIREIEKAKGRFKKRPVNGEKTSIENMRRSIVAKFDIAEDTTITEDMLILKRPGTGLSAKYFDFVIGRKPKKLIYKDTVILTSHLK
ncbi:hypothetical protein LCGC14_2755880, partial [marine sediment metagenome]